RNNIIYGWFNGVLFLTTTGVKYNNSNISGNVIYDIFDDGIELEEIVHGVRVYDNNVTSTFQTISLSPANSSTKTSLIYNNVFIANRTVWATGSTFWEASAFKIIKTGGTSIDNFNITHNTIFGRGIYAQGMANSQHNTVWKDNIFYSLDQTIIRVSGLSSDNVFYDYNLYFRNDSGVLFDDWNNDAGATYTSLALARASGDWDGTWDNSSVNQNPLFIDFANGDYKPQNIAITCLMSSTGSYVGALPCSGSDSESPTYTVFTNNASVTDTGATSIVNFS
ncbi:unnamed protein product, partial [marine sediment metagenome]